MWRSILAIALMGALVACGRSSGENAAASGGAPDKITIACTTQPQSTLIHVAREKGFFADEKLDVQTSMHTYGKAALGAVLAGEADLATVAETPLMFSVLRGEAIAVIANIEASNVNNAVVARRDAGILASADLKGKRIAFTPGTTSDFFLDSLLVANQLTRAEIVAIEMKPEEMLAAMVGKTVDAVSTWNYPLATIRRRLGAEAVNFFDREIYTETFNVAAMQEFSRKNPEAIRRFLRALIKAEEFVAKNPREAQAIVAAAVNVDRELVAEVWDAFNYRVVLDQSLVITLEDETRWAMKNKLAAPREMPDYASYFYLDGLQAVKPEAIRMKR